MRNPSDRIRTCGLVVPNHRCAAHLGRKHFEKKLPKGLKTLDFLTISVYHITLQTGRDNRTDFAKSAQLFLSCVLFCAVFKRAFLNISSHLRTSPNAAAHLLNIVEHLPYISKSKGRKTIKKENEKNEAHSLYMG